MSTDHKLLNRVLASELFDGRLEKFGICEHVEPDKTNETTRCLTDGRSYLWVYVDDDGSVCCLSRYGTNCPQKIVDAIADAANSEVVSEHEPQFWGFETQEEWAAAMREAERKYKQEFRIQIYKFIRGEPNNILPGTNGEAKAKIARALVEQDPSLLLPISKDELFNKMDAVYDRDHSVVVNLTPHDMASIEMLATHEDDLPQA